MWPTRGPPGGWPLPGYEELGSQSLQRRRESSREPDETHMIAFVPEGTADLMNISHLLFSPAVEAVLQLQ